MLSWLLQYRITNQLSPLFPQTVMVMTQNRGQPWQSEQHKVGQTKIIIPTNHVEIVVALKFVRTLFQRFVPCLGDISAVAGNDLIIMQPNHRNI